MKFKSWKFREKSFIERWRRSDNLGRVSSRKQRKRN